MSLKVPDAGLLRLLPVLTGETYTLHLYKNDYTPVSGSDTGNFSEATFKGYSGGVTLANWTTPTIVSGRAVSTPDPVDQTYNSAAGGDASNTIYGYYVKDGAGDLVWAERDPNPVVMDTNGQIYRVEAIFTFKSEF